MVSTELDELFLEAGLTGFVHAREVGSPPSAPEVALRADERVILAREILGWSAEEVGARVAGIGGTLAEVFARARTERISTERAGLILPNERLRSARSAS